jgi:hypothetical protein
MTVLVERRDSVYICTILKKKKKKKKKTLTPPTPVPSPGEKGGGLCILHVKVLLSMYKFC